MYKRIGDLARRYRTLTAANLSALIRQKSLSGAEEKVQLELMRQMEEAGFDEVRMDGLGNVIGRIGHGSRIVAVDGHVDTVDAGNENNWTFPPFSGEVRGDRLLGRGATDQKGGVAAFVTAGKILKELGFDRDMTVYFTGTVMEEDCDGLCWKYLIEEDGIRPEVVVCTEPTSLKIYTGQRGRMEMHVSFRGLSAHGSAPERGRNAIYQAAHAALEIEKLNDMFRPDDILGKGSITISEIVSGSPSLCAVADYARLHLDRRLTLGETKESALQEIRELTGKLDAEVTLLEYRGKSFTGLEYGMEKYYPTWKLENDHTLIRKAGEASHKVFGRAAETGVWTFSTNGVVINGIYGIPVIGFGPGNEVMAHAPDEMVSIGDLEAASAFYAAFILAISE
jgi:putative selenium metabolism hydrolase